MDVAVMIVLTAFLFMISGCNYYKMVTIQTTGSDDPLSKVLGKVYPERKYPRDQYLESNLEQMFLIQHQIYIMSEHKNWQLVNPSIINDTIFGKAMMVPGSSNDHKSSDKKKSKRYSRSEKPDIVKRVNLYAEIVNINDSGDAIIPAAGISKCQIYKKDVGREVGVTIGIFFIVVGVAALVAAIVAASTSCPFVYVFDGHEWQFCGEVYGGAVYPSLERDDYLALPQNLAGQGTDFTIKIANMLREVQYINQADLVILQHDSTVKALIDQHGCIQTVTDPILPVSAINSKGEDCKGMISFQDGLTYNFSEPMDTLQGQSMNNLEMIFTSDTNPDSAKIFIQAKNSLWGDHLIHDFFDLFGNKYKAWMKSQENVPATSQLEWMQQQGLFLQVYVMKDREWQQAAYFNLVGAFSSREMVLPINVKDAWTVSRSDSSIHYNLKVKMVAGYRFWELDYAALDLSKNVKVSKIVVPPYQVMDQRGKEVGKLLASDDDNYLIQKDTGDEAVLNFSLPGTIGKTSSIFLHSKGYYQQSLKSKNKPDIALLETFTQPGRLSIWSYAKYENDVIAFKALTNSDTNGK